MTSNSGYIVLTKHGKQGRTYHNKGLINNKVPVYLEICHVCGGEGEHTSECGSRIGGFSMVKDTAILCDGNSLRIIGYID